MLRLSGHIPITENQVSPLEQIFHQCLRTSNCFLNFVPGADWGIKCIKKKKKALSLGGGGIRVHVPPYRLYYLGRLRDFSPVPVGPLVSSFHLVCGPLIILRKYPACHPTQNQSALLSF